MPDVEEHSFRHNSSHLTRFGIDYEQRLPAFDLPRIGTLVFHPGNDSSFVVAKAYAKLDAVVGIWNIGHRKNHADTDVDLIQDLPGYGRFDRGGRHADHFGTINQGQIPR